MLAQERIFCHTYHGVIRFMKFLCLCRYDIAGFSKLTPADFQEIAALCAPHDQALRESGRVNMIGSLGMPHETMVLRANSDKKVEAQPGPFQNEAEPVGAFFVVDATSIEHAIQIAKLHPGNHLADKFGGGIEIMPIGDLWTSAGA